MDKEMDASDKLSMSLEDIAKLKGENSSRGGRHFRGSRGGGGFHSSRSSHPFHDKSFVHKGGSESRVYVSNLDYRTSWQDLKDHFKKSGNVLFADIFLDDDGKSKGCGIVEFSTKDEAKQAIQNLNDTKIENTERSIFVREDRETPTNNNNSNSNSNNNNNSNRSGGFGDRKVRGGYNDRSSNDRSSNDRSSNDRSSNDKKISRQVFVGNLPYHTSWQDLKDHFRGCGKIVRADVLIGQDGRSKGSGTILFEHKWEALKAIETMNETEFQGRTIYVNEDKFATTY